MDNYSKETIRFTDNLVSTFARYNKDDGLYYLDADMIPETELEGLTSCLMLDSLDQAVESTGPDNDSYDRRMLPSLIDLLKNSTDKDNQIEFIRNWKAGTVNYFHHNIEQLIEERLELYNEDHRCAA